MPTQLQFRRGNTAQHSTFTGAVGEITIDTDKNTVVVHDGVTPGGQPLAVEGSGGGGGFTNGQSISVANLEVTGSFTANGSTGSAGQVLASNGTALYWKTDNNDAAAAYANAVADAASDATSKAASAYSNAMSDVSATYAPKTDPLFFGNVTFFNAKLVAMGSVGSPGQVLTSDGTTNGVYWSTISAGFANGSSLTANVVTADIVSTNNLWTSGYTKIGGPLTIQTTGEGYGTLGQVLTSDGNTVYWSTPSGGVNQAITKSSFTGDGTTTDFTLSSNTVGADDILVYVDGFYYHPEEDYNVSTAGTLSFVGAPVVGAEIRVRYIRTPDTLGSSSAGDMMTLTGTEDLGTGTGSEDLMV